jgi:hypothetical protein
MRICSSNNKELLSFQCCCKDIQDVTEGSLQGVGLKHPCQFDSLVLWVMYMYIQYYCVIAIVLFQSFKFGCVFSQSTFAP